MRKKTCNHLADTIFWYLLYMLPVLAWLFTFLCGSVFDLGTFFTDIGLGFASDNIIIDTLALIFGQNGVLPLFLSNTPLLIFAWFVSVFLCHLLVDFLLFIPRLCHKYFDAFYQGD